MCIVHLAFFFSVVIKKKNTFGFFCTSLDQMTVAHLLWKWGPHKSHHLLISTCDLEFASYMMTFIYGHEYVDMMMWSYWSYGD